jgi:hypothetical protein
MFYDINREFFNEAHLSTRAILMQAFFQRPLTRESLLKGKDHYSCGLYYKHMTIVNDNSSVVSEQSFLLIDDASGVIYDRRMFIMQANDLLVLSSSDELILN